MAGVESKPTGFCFLFGMHASTCILHRDEEIISEVKKVKPAVVAVDAPLALPKGRKSLKQREAVHFRQCDRELLKMKIKFFPITLGPMRKLTERGIGLRKALDKRGFEVIETYPGAVQDILKIPRKQKGLSELRGGLENLGVEDLNNSMSGDELDAVTCALVGKMYLEGKYLAIGNPEEILMILPKRGN